VESDTPLPQVVVVGMGPAGPELVSDGARDAISGAAGGRVFLRTARHPSADFVAGLAPVAVECFDGFYEDSSSFEEVYRRITEALVVAAWEGREDGGRVVYAVPGSPLVAERSVELLREDGRVEVAVVPSLSFLDLAWDRLGVDPVACSVRLVDATDFSAQAAADRGPLLVAQAYNLSVLSDVKLAVDDQPVGDGAAVLLHHLGLPDEAVVAMSWADIDRAGPIEPDHLTSLWIPKLGAPVAGEIVRLEEFVRTLRERCPWDRRQTHGSLGRHLLEEAYEVLDAIEDTASEEPDVSAPTVVHLEEELGDLLFQVVFHSVLATEKGRFTLADVARGIREKLVGRHPHVFGDAVAQTPEDVALRWEVLKREEQGRNSVTDGIPRDLPALALAAKLQRKAAVVGMDGAVGTDRALGMDGAAGTAGRRDGQSRDRQVVLDALDRLATLPAGSTGETLEADRSTVADVADALLALADLARRLGVDPESALRARALRLAGEIRQAESTGS